jgi:hypothetical protein
LGTHFTKLRFANLNPILDHLDQARPPGIVASAGMSPVRRVVNIAARYSVVVEPRS